MIPFFAHGTSFGALEGEQRANSRGRSATISSFAKAYCGEWKFWSDGDFYKRALIDESIGPTSDEVKAGNTKNA